MSDGERVVIKQVARGSNEVSIGQFFSSPELLADPKNHCVRILDVFSDDMDPELEFIVMPALVKFNFPPFFLISEIVEFIRQTLEVRICLLLEFPRRLTPNRAYNSCTSTTWLIGRAKNGSFFSG